MKSKIGKKMKRIITLCFLAMFCVVAGFGAYFTQADAATATIHTIPNEDLTVANATTALTIGDYTLSSWEWKSSVNGKVETEDLGGGYTDYNFLIPYNGESSINLYTPLTLYFEDVGSIAGRSLNATVKIIGVDLTKESQYYADQWAAEGYVKLVDCYRTTIGIAGMGIGSEDVTVTVDVTYADTGDTVDLPFYQKISDLDVHQTYNSNWEAWEGFASTYTGEIYKYPSCVLTFGSGTNGYIASANSAITDLIDSGVEIEGDNSMLYAGCYAATNNGYTKMVFSENYCATALELFSAYLDGNLKEPTKTVNTTSAYDGDTITYTVTQPIHTFYSNTFTYYDNFTISDVLPEEVEYVSATLTDDGKDVTSTYGTLNFDSATRTVKYTIDDSVLQNEDFYDGGDIVLTIKTKAVNKGKTTLTATNAATTDISGIEQTTSEVSTKIYPYFDVDTKIEHGSITASMTDIPLGAYTSVTWKADDGYYVDSVTVDGNSVTVDNDDGDTYAFSNISADHTVSVVCKPYYKITTDITNGTITDDITKIKAGADKTVTWKADDGYYVESVTVDGDSVKVADESGDSYTFEDIVANHTVSVVCAPYYKVTTKIDEGGSITDSYSKLHSGDDYDVSWIVNSGYYVTSVTVDGDVVYSGTKISGYPTSNDFSNIKANHSVVVTTAKIPYLIITKTTDKTSYEYEDTVTYTIIVEQTVSDATATNVVITDKDVTEGLVFDLDTLTCDNKSAVIDKDTNGFTITIDSLSYNEPVTITIQGTVDNDTLVSSDIKNTATVNSDQTDKITDDADISIYYRVDTEVVNGTITPSDDTIKRGEDRTVEYTPDEGYYLAEILVDGDEQDLTDYADAVTLSDIKTNHTVKAVFEKIPELEITKKADGETYTDGDTIYYTVKVTNTMKDSVAENVVIEDTSLPDGAVLNTDSISCDADICEITTKNNGFTIVVPELAYNDTVTVTYSASVVGKKLDSSKIKNTATATFTNGANTTKTVKDTAEVDVEFKIVTSVTNGTITDPIDGISVGENKTISYSANDGYVLSKIYVDGEEVDIDKFTSEYVFSDIHANHTIEVVYEKAPAKATATPGPTATPKVTATPAPTVKATATPKPTSKSSSQPKTGDFSHPGLAAFLLIVTGCIIGVIVINRRENKNRK